MDFGWTSESRRSGGRWTWTAVCLVSCLALVGCPDEDGSDDEDESRIGDAIDDTSRGDVDAEAGGDAEQTCEPGELVQCAEEDTARTLECNSQGTGTMPASCPDSHVCRDAECVEVPCVPGDGRCSEVGDVAERCREVDGELQWVEDEQCEGETRCEDGACLNRCELAAQTNSYIGCEYWAAELENHLLYEERETGDPIPDDEMPPFGVVLANTSENYQAEVTVYQPDGSPAEAIPSRRVGTDLPSPDLTKETVYTRVLDAQGGEIVGHEQFDDRPVQSVPLPSGSMMTLILPNRRIPDGATTVRKNAYRIESTQPIVAYQFNPYCCNYNYTNDASLLMPTSSLTGNYTYMSYPVWDSPQREEGENPESPGISVVATEPETEVTVDLREPREEGHTYQDLIYPIEGDRVSGPTEEGELSVTLEEAEILNVAGRGLGEDLSGARIDANKPVSTFGTHSCAYVPFAKPACDHLESQLLPMETWGARFTATPLKKRGPEDEFTREGTYWKLLAQRDGTSVETGLNLNPGPEGVLPAAGEGVPGCAEFSPEPSEGEIELDAGESCEFGTQTTFVAESNEPILLGAFLSGQNSVGEDVDHAGDPAFFLVPPENQYRSSYSFLTPETYYVNYVTVTVPTGVRNVVLDGEEIDLTGLETYERFPDAQVARAHIEVEAGPHRISTPNSIPFGIVSYGYDDYVSYAYTGGLDLAKRNDVE